MPRAFAPDPAEEFGHADGVTEGQATLETATGRGVGCSRMTEGRRTLLTTLLEPKGMERCAS
ncbi:hypothetical protein V8J36_21095 [Frigidibacter sp. MR17.14]|uniref:hypothetical protein n=1 Tax=Frigidibacter sp. MR17.14 TaxID=3126509 RepID=UPI003012DA4A